MQRRSLLHLALGLSLLPAAAVLSDAAQERDPPSVTEAGVEYRALHEPYTVEGKPGGLRFSIEARDGKTKKALWKARLFDAAGPNAQAALQERGVWSVSREQAAVLALTRDGKAYLVEDSPRIVRQLPSTTGGSAHPVLGPRPEGNLVADRRGREGHCQIHREALREDVVPIRYGLIRFRPEQYAIMEKTPNANVLVLGGCVVGTARWARVRYCPSCRTEAAQLQRKESKDAP